MAIIVDWNGAETPITSSNAYAIYQDYIEGDIDDMSSAAINACKNYLSDEEVEEIEENYYNSEEGGAAELGEDAENAENSKNPTGNASATGVGSAAGGAAVWQIAKQSCKMANKTGFLAAAWAVISMAAAAGTLLLVEAYDGDYDNRCSAKNNADNTNSILEEHANELIESQESMNNDMDAYSEASEEYTLAVNENTSNKANLEAQLKACQASGDTAGAESIQSQLDSLAEESEETTTEGMDEIQENMTEYQNMAATSTGAAGAGQSVSDFLKPGTGLGVAGYVDAVWLAAAMTLTFGAVISAGVGAASDAAKWNWAGVAAGVAGGIMFGLSAIVIGRSAQRMAQKSDEELECGSAGRDMQGYVNTLNDEITNQEAYMGFTTETYGEVDAASEESQANASEAAGKVLANNGVTTTDDEETKKASGTAAATA